MTFQALYSFRRNRGLKSEVVDDVQVKFDVFGKKTPYIQIFTNVFRKDSWRHRSTFCVQISWNLADRKSAKSCVIYMTKKTKFRLAVQLSLLRVSRRKSAVASPRQCTQSAPDFIQIRSLSAELYPNARTPSESESNIRLKPNFEPNKN